jgi:hypothetical protein
VIAFGSAVTAPKVYERCAVPGIRRAAEADSVVLVQESPGTLFQNYNRLLDKAGALENLAALALIHQDAEIADPAFAATVREALRDPDVAIVGCVGAVGVRGLAWWRGTLTWAGITHTYPEYGGGSFPGPTWDPQRVPPRAELGEVDTVDGFVMVLSPWAVRNLRFDESLGTLHGYDFDICMQARTAGKKVVTADFRAIHHHSLELVQDTDAWISAYMKLAEKWAGHLPEPEGDSERRALRAEAEADCAAAISASRQYRVTAIDRQLSRLNEELARTRVEVAAARRDAEDARSKLQEVMTSSSWRLTVPLRALRRRLRRSR